MRENGKGKEKDRFVQRDGVHKGTGRREVEKKWVDKGEARAGRIQ